MSQPPAAVCLSVCLAARQYSASGIWRGILTAVCKTDHATRRILLHGRGRRHVGDVMYASKLLHDAHVISITDDKARQRELRGRSERVLSDNAVAAPGSSSSAAAVVRYVTSIR